MMDHACRLTLPAKETGVVGDGAAGMAGWQSGSVLSPGQVEGARAGRNGGVKKLLTLAAIPSEPDKGVAP